MAIWTSPSKHLAAAGRGCRPPLSGCPLALPSRPPRGARGAQPCLLPQSSHRPPLPFPDLAVPLRALYLGRKQGNPLVVWPRPAGQGGGGRQAAPHRGSPAGLPSPHPGIINLRVKQLFVCPHSLSRAAFSLLLIYRL